MEKFDEYFQIIETALAKLGINPVEARCSEKGQWLLFNGETEIYIDLWSQSTDTGWLYFKSDDEVCIFQVISPVCYLPEDKLETLYEELLHNNLNLLNASYTINKDENMLATHFRRVANNLTESDVIETIESIGFYSASTLDLLSERYGVKKIEAEKK